MAHSVAIERSPLPKADGLIDCLLVSTFGVSFRGTPKAGQEEVENPVLEESTDVTINTIFDDFMILNESKACSRLNEDVAVGG